MRGGRRQSGDRGPVIGIWDNSIRFYRKVYSRS
jgi:hypothetical protein